MACEYSPTPLFLYLDGELALPEALEVESHLRTCPACQQIVTTQHRLQTLLRAALPEEEVPPRLWAAVQHTLDAEIAAAPRPTPWVRRHWLWPGVAALAAGIMLALAGRLWLAPKVSYPVKQIVASAVRTRLMGTAYTSLPADPAAIRQWFQDKVEFAVLVPQLPAERYAFHGVRLNYFLDRRVAEMVYSSGPHVLTFFMFANDDLALTYLSTVHVGTHTVYVRQYKGYSTVLWKDGEAICGIVSDANIATLLRTFGEAMGVASAS